MHTFISMSLDLRYLDKYIWKKNVIKLTPRCLEYSRIVDESQFENAKWATFTFSSRFVWFVAISDDKLISISYDFVWISNRQTISLDRRKQRVVEDYIFIE